jgi:hypothetical protein
VFERKLLRADEALIRVPKKTEEEAETKEKKTAEERNILRPCKTIMEQRPRLKVKDSS